MWMQTCTWTELLQMLGVTTIGSQSHVGSQALGEDHFRLVDVFSWHLFPNDLQSDFQLINCLMLQLEFMILFQHDVQDVAVQWVQTWRAWGPLSLVNEPVRIQSILHDARILRNAGCRSCIILSFSDVQGGPKTGPLLKVCNSRIWWRRKAFNKSKCSALY